MNENLDKVDDSVLAPWKKFDDINTFVLPCISFHLKNGVEHRKSLTDFDKKLKVAGKKWLNLPQCTGADQLYLSYQMKGIKLLLMNVLADVSHLVHRIHLLQLTTLMRLSKRIFQTMVEKQIRRVMQPYDLENYLSG
jgi:hypothetical protein